MKSFILAFAVIITSSTIAFGQAKPVAATASDKQSQEILKGVSAKYKTYKSLKATFNVTMENPADKSKDTQKGTLWLKGDKYKLNIVGQEIISDGKTVWTYVKDGNEVQVNNVKTDESAITPSNIFTIYEKGFLSKYMGEENIGGVTTQQVELVPADGKKKSYFKIKLNINKAEKFITSAKVYNKNGTINTISVDKFNPDAANDDALFTFNAASYPGAEVIDLR